LPTPLSVMSHHLPPNLLRLFQPRPALPFAPALKKDKDPRKVPNTKIVLKTIVDEDKDVIVVPTSTSKLQGVGPILEKLKQDAADKGEATMDVEVLEGMDEQGKEYTLAEQTKRELRREEKKKAYEENKARQLAECKSISVLPKM
jgi:U1 small nuclear ribonucleoprotein